MPVIRVVDEAHAAADQMGLQRFVPVAGHHHGLGAGAPHQVHDPADHAHAADGQQGLELPHAGGQARRQDDSAQPFHGPHLSSHKITPALSRKGAAGATPNASGRA